MDKFFKKGDKIRRIKNSWGDTKYGEIYTVSNDTYKGNSTVKLINHFCIYDITAFELVESSESTFIPEFIN